MGRGRTAARRLAGRAAGGALIAGATCLRGGAVRPLADRACRRSPHRTATHLRAFALVSHGLGAAWREDDEAATLTIDRAALAAPLPALSQRMVASASGRGARVELGSEAIARVDIGRALGVFAPDGTLLRAFEFAAGAPLRVPFQELVYEMKGEKPCVNVSVDSWTDVTPVFSTGSWVAH
jgi:hypothetical protein